jgi:hypothetical protein
MRNSTRHSKRQSRTRRGGDSWWNRFGSRFGSLKKTSTPKPASPVPQLETKVAALEAKLAKFTHLLRTRLLKIAASENRTDSEITMLKEDSARKNSEITILKEDSDRKIEWFREIGDLIVNAEREQKQLNDKVNEISLNIAQLENYGRAIELARQRRQNALAEK